MTALAANLTPIAWAQGWIKETRQAAAGTYATGKRGFYGSLNIGVDGVAQPLVSGTAMQSLCKSFPGGDANSGLFVSARQGGVRVALVSGLAESINIVNGSTIDISVTYNNGTSTPLTVANLIRSNGKANELLRVKHSGTGAGVLLVAAALAAVPFIGLLGVTESEIDNSAGVAPLALSEWAGFHVGCYGLVPDPAATPPLNSIGVLLDDQTVTATPDPLAITAPVLQTDPRGFMFVNLSEAR